MKMCENRGISSLEEGSKIRSRNGNPRVDEDRSVRCRFGVRYFSLRARQDGDPSGKEEFKEIREEGITRGRCRWSSPFPPGAFAEGPFGPGRSEPDLSSGALHLYGSRTT